MENYKIEELEEETIVRISKNKNYTIYDLKQKLVNQLYKSSDLRNLEKEIELLDIILRNTIKKD